MKYLKYILLLVAAGLFHSCVKDLLDQQPTTSVSSDLFWKTTDDALTSTLGVYQATRTLFGRDYYFDGVGEFQYTRGTSGGSVGNNFYQTNGGNFGSMWNDAYRVINRANFTILNIEAMIQRTTHEETKKQLERVNGENYFLRSLAYFRLIQLWGDVPFYTKVLEGDNEAITLSRIPISEIKDNLIKDLTYAASVLPAKITNTGERGRATQVAALAFRGKIELYWASWKKYGWPELDGFTQSESEAGQAYQKAADDFKKVIYDYGLKLFSEGNPGTYDNPAYGRLFQYYSEYDPEIIFSVQYGGPNLGQGEEMLRDFGTRTTGNAQCWVMPCNRLADRYQSLTTGDFVDPLVLSNNPATPHGALNPQSYEDRDWRMKATLIWEGQTIQGISNDGYSMTGTFIMKMGVREAPYINNDASGQTGYL
ncbi:MAG: RagB/SusD family nutrient uptake outer membrane protein, partial [Dysgonamonadaceae bacterium]|nr:RagB/SusD family nutrient uptake outer membrane protein [Dysgonamonadaceae bacterium]